MGDTPQFSIVIPTRNRARLLRGALQSLCNQTFRDFEVIISDDHSEDDTRSVVASFADARFRLVSPPTRFAMADHYEFAASHARGEYINFMPDRSLFYSKALARIKEIIDQSKHPLIGWNGDRYDDGDVLNCRMYQYRRSGKITQCSSDRLLRAYYRMDLQKLGFPAATPASSMCHRRLVEKIRKEGTGRLVNPVIPDMTFPVAALANSPSFLRIDESLCVAAGHWASIGANMHANRASAVAALVGASSNGFCSRVPCRGLFANANLVADDLLMLRELMPSLRRYHLDIARYFDTLRGDLSRMNAAGGDHSAEWRTYSEGFRRMPATVKLRMLAARLTRKVRRGADRVSSGPRKRVVRTMGGAASPAGAPQATSLGAMPPIEAVAWAEAHPLK